MAAGSLEKPLVVIVGPTASGKTSLAIELAEQFGGEIICADSRTVYRNMDIGTAKPTVEEQAKVPHWGLNLAKPNERFTAADFKQYAEQKIADIRGRGRIPFLVGGTGLYVDGVVFDYQFGTRADEVLRARFDAMDIDALQKYCVENNVKLPENTLNKRYIIRAIEQKSINTKRRTIPIDHTIIVGITTNKDDLRTRIGLRAEQLFENGVVQEAITLGEKYGWSHESMTGNIYPLVHQYLNKEMTLDEVKERFIALDWRLAKRQMTWLRRNPHIKWCSLEDSRRYLSTQLATE